MTKTLHISGLVFLLMIDGCGTAVNDTADMIDPLDSIDILNDTAVTDIPVKMPAGMVLVPEGTFWMGCDPEAYEWCGETNLFHEIFLDAYFIDRTEVTNQAYQECVDAGVCTHHLDDKTCLVFICECNCVERNALAPINREDTRPMICVDWHQARQYCEWAGKRLPTEAEWAKAARGSDGRIYPWGNSDLEKFPATCPSNIIEQHSCIYNLATDVCSQSPAGDSPFGACDMTGNVEELVNDWYDPYYYQDSPATNPRGPDSGTFRTVRGGSYTSTCNPTFVRRGTETGRAESAVGFRCAKDYPASD